MTGTAVELYFLCLHALHALHALQLQYIHLLHYMKMTSLRAIISYAVGPTTLLALLDVRN